MKGYIYEIHCNKTHECYIGATFNLFKRLKKHKVPSNCCSSKKIVDRGDYTFYILEEMDVDSPAELQRRESELIAEAKKCVNVQKKVFSPNSQDTSKNYALKHFI